MPISIAESHPIFVRAREAARARPEFRIARAPAPVGRLSNAPVRLTYSGPPIVMALSASAPAAPSELPPPSPPTPDPAPPEVTDIPPSSVPLPTHQPPGMTPPIA